MVNICKYAIATNTVPLVKITVWAGSWLIPFIIIELLYHIPGYCTIFQAIFWGDITLHRPYIGLKKRLKGFLQTFLFSSTNGKRSSSDVILRSLQFHPELFSVTLRFCLNSYWKWPCIASFPRKMVIFHSFLHVYQRVTAQNSSVRNMFVRPFMLLGASAFPLHGLWYCPWYCLACYPN